jgi:glycosyltransferase involved in cell wall biosynthesis
MSSEKHIIWVIMDFHPVYTGHGIYLQKLEPYLAQEGYSFTVLTPKQSVDVPEEEVIGNISVKRIECTDKKGVNFLSFSLRSCFYLWKKRKNYHIIHIHGFFDRFGIFGIFSKVFRKKLIMQMVLLGVDDPFSCVKSYKFHRIRSFFFSLFDKFITISSPLTKACFEFGIKKEKVIQIAQGVDTNIFRPVASNEEKIKLREKLKLPQDQKIAIFVGAIIERKGVRELLLTWERIQSNSLDCLLLLLGPDSFYGTLYNTFVLEMKSFVSQKKLNISFAGSVDNVEEYLRASDIFVFPSRKEGFGNVIIEAMSCGLPCIVTPMDGVAYDTVSHGETGYIVKDQEDLEKALRDLFNNQDMCIQFGKIGRQHTTLKFDFFEISKKYSRVYSQLCLY